MNPRSPHRRSIELADEDPAAFRRMPFGMTSKPPSGHVNQRSPRRWSIKSAYEEPTAFRRMSFDMTYSDVLTHPRPFVALVARRVPPGRRHDSGTGRLQARRPPAAESHRQLAASMPTRPQVRIEPVFELRDCHQVRPLVAVEDPDNDGVLQAAHLGDLADAAISDRGPEVDGELTRDSRGYDQTLVARLPRHSPPLRLSDPRGRRLRPVDKLTRSLTRRSGHTTSVDDPRTESRATRTRRPLDTALQMVLSSTIAYRLTGTQIPMTRPTTDWVSGGSADSEPAPNALQARGPSRRVIDRHQANFSPHRDTGRQVSAIRSSAVPPPSTTETHLPTAR